MVSGRSDYLEELKKVEVTRAVQLDKEEGKMIEMLEKLRDNPNVHLHEISTEVSLLQNKIGPILDRVEQAQAMVQKAANPGALSN